MTAPVTSRDVPSAALGRSAHAVGREVVAAVVVAVLLAIAMTWPALRHPTSTIPSNLGDPLLEAWELAWNGHALATHPGGVLNTNAFWPLRDTMAFTDSLLGYAPLSVFGSGIAAALLRYNLIYVGSYALAFLGGYLLARQLGLRRLPALVAGAIYGFAPWRIQQSGHLHVISDGAVALSLALLARGHGIGRRASPPRRFRPAAALGGWLMAAWQVTIGFTNGLPLAYLLGIATLAAAAWWWRTGRPLPRRLLLADTVGIVIFVGVGLAMAAPYFAVVAAHPEARRGIGELALYSPPWYGFFTTPAADWLWGGAQHALRARLTWAAEMTLAPGFTATALAAVGFAVPTWSRIRRIVLALTLAVLVALALGTRFLAAGRWTIVPLVNYAPGWAGIRAPGRLVVFITLFLALLAAAALEALPRRMRWLTGVALGLVLLEGVSALAYPSPPPVPAAFRAARPPILVLPSGFVSDELAMFWSIDGFPALVNGSSGFVPTELARLRTAVAGFPNAASVRYLRAHGVRSVVLVPGMAAGTPWAGAAGRPVTGLPLRRVRYGTDLLYELN